MATHKSMVDRHDKGESIIENFDDYVVIDLETTGLSPSEDEIIEFGAVLVKDGQVVDTFSKLANPRRSIDINISTITGITNEMLSSAPDIADVLFEFLHFIKDYPLIGHNVGFDVNFLYDSSMRHFGHGIDNVHVNTVRMARRMFPTLFNYQLATCLDCFGIMNDSSHRALSDALCTQRLYESLKSIFKDRCDNANTDSCSSRKSIHPSVKQQIMTYESVYEDVLHTLGADTEGLRMDILKSRAGVYMFRRIAFYIRINSKNQCLDMVPEFAADYIDRIKGSYVNKSTELFTVPLVTDEVSKEATHELIRKIYDYFRTSVTGDSFACCNDFIACSDARKCIKPINSDYSGCQYRKNLEAGRIFYGKNKNC